MIFIDELGHMATDGAAEELHRLAASIGLRSEWYQDQGSAEKHPHYDVMGARKRAAAIAAGAVEVGSKELIRKCWGGKLRG